MPETTGLHELQSLDRAAGDARSLLRRAGKLAAQLEDADDQRLSGLAADLRAAAEQLVMALEEKRAERRQQLRRQLLGNSEG